MATYLLHIYYIFTTYFLHISYILEICTFYVNIKVAYFLSCHLQIPFGFGTDRLCSRVWASRGVGIFGRVVLFGRGDVLDGVGRLAM